jgi:hypothetical protein
MGSDNSKLTPGTMKAAERDLLSFSELDPQQIKVKKVYVD